MAVWIPDFFDYFNKTLAGIKVDGKAITVSQSKPDITARQQDMETLLPEVNFSFYNVLDDKQRYQSDILLNSSDPNNTSDVLVKPPAVPRNVFFQFVLAAKYLDDIVQMESQFTTLFPDRAVIQVLDPSVNDTYALDMYKVQYTVADTDQLPTPHQGEVPIRLFRRLYRYYIRCEQDIYNWTEVPKAQTINPSTSQTN